MFRVIVLLLVASSGLCLPTQTALAQRGRRFFDQTDYQRLGLQQAWSTQIQLDSRRAGVDAVMLQVVGLNSYQRLQELVYRVFEVTYDGRSIRFSENDVDANGQLIGRAEAQRLAEKQVILSEARGFKPTLTTRDIPPTVIYVQSTSGTLHAMDAETGKTLWAVTVGNPRWPMLTPAANDDYVATINGSSLYLLDRATGEPVWNRPVGMNPTLSLAMSGSWVFVPGLNGQVEGYRLPSPEYDSRVAEPWVYHSGVQVTGAPAIGSTTVSWATDRGQMFVADVEGPTILYRRQAGGPIHGRAMFLPPDRWVVASTDGYVTALDERSGAVQWELSTGSDIYQAPITQSDFTYVVTRKNELFCISSADGLEQWMSPGIEQMLACGTDRIFARGTGGRLVALDKPTGKPIGSLAAHDYRVGYSNYLTDRIYLLTTSGTLLCLREETAHYPTLHVPLPQPKTTEAPATTTATPAGTAAAEPTPPAGDEEPVDVFGPDMFDNEADDAAAPAAADPAAPDAIEDDLDAPAETPPAEDADEPQEESDDPFDFG